VSKTSNRSHLLSLLEPAVTAAGLDLEDVDVTSAGKRRLLRVIVDKDGGVDLDAVAQVSQAISGVLDSTDAMGGQPYVLEVTSPGIDRPLTETRHWRRARGRLVEVGIRSDGGPGRPVVGRVVSVGDEGVDLDVAGVEQSYSWADLGPGRVQVEFHRPEGTEEA
jgi:ribosome maturation factor RimP